MDNIEKLEEIKSELKNEIGAIEKTVAGMKEEWKRSAPVDEAEVISDQINAGLRSDNKEWSRSLDEGVLTESKVQKLVPAVSGADFEAVCKVEETDVYYANIGLAPSTTLDYDVTSSSEFTPTVRQLTLKNAGAYQYFSESQMEAASIDISKEFATSFLTNKNNTIKSKFVTGDASIFKGLKQYTATTTFGEDGKLYTKEVGSDAGATAAEIYAGLVAIGNTIVEGDKVAVLNGSTISTLMAIPSGQAVSYLELLKAEMEIVRNDYMESVGDSKIVGCVMVKGRGYAVAKTRKIVTTKNYTADKAEVYTGIGLAGCILDEKAVAVIKVAAAA